MKVKGGQNKTGVAFAVINHYVLVSKTRMIGKIFCGRLPNK